MRLANTASRRRARSGCGRPARPACPPDSSSPGTILTVTQGANTDTQIVESVLAEVLTEGAQGGLAPVTYRVTFALGPQSAARPRPRRRAAPTATLERDQAEGHARRGHRDLRPAVDGRRRIRATSSTSSTTIPAACSSRRWSSRRRRTASPIAIPRAAAAAPTIPAQDGTRRGPVEPRGRATSPPRIDTLHAIDDVNIIAVPDRPTAPAELMSTVQQALIAHCELLADRFAVLDCDPGVPLFGAGSLEEQRRGLDSTRGYAALYHPWLRVVPAQRRPADPGAAERPRVRHLRAQRHQRAACTRRRPTRSSTARSASRRRISLIEQGQLNLQGINVIRVFQDGGRPIVWGARTTATDTQLAVRQHPPAVPLPRGVDPGGHPLGGVRAEQPVAVAEAQAHARPTS